MFYNTYDPWADWYTPGGSIGQSGGGYPDWGGGGSLGGWLSGMPSPGPSFGGGYWPFRTPRAPSFVRDPQSGFAGETVSRIWSAEPEGVMESQPDLRYPTTASGLPRWAELRIAEIGYETGVDWWERLRNLPLSSIPSWFWDALNVAWGKTVRDQIPEAERATTSPETGKVLHPPGTPRPGEGGRTREQGPATGGYSWRQQVAILGGAAAGGILIGMTAGGERVWRNPNTGEQVTDSGEPGEPVGGYVAPVPVPSTLPSLSSSSEYLQETLTPSGAGGGGGGGTGTGGLSDIASAIGRALQGNQQGGLPGMGGSSGLGGLSALRSLFEMAPYIGKGAPTLGQLLAAGR